MTYQELALKVWGEGMNSYQLMRYAMLKPGRTFPDFMAAFAEGFNSADGLSKEARAERIVARLQEVVEMRETELDV